MLLKKDFYWGAIRNMVVYDSQAKSGELTERLLELMCRVWKDNSPNNQMTNIYIGQDKNFISEFDDRITVIDNMNEFEDYFIKDLKHSFPIGDKELIVFLDTHARISDDTISQNPADKKKRYNTEYVLLGSY